MGTVRANKFLWLSIRYGSGIPDDKMKTCIGEAITDKSFSNGM